MNVERYRPTERFSAKARFYDYRPDYPAEIIDLLRRDLRLEPRHVVADVGAGTGKLTRLFLDNGNRVFALEPNEAMLAVLRRNLPARDNLTALRRPAEATGLGDGSVDFIVVGQAFHWFDLEKVRIEFARILKTPGYLALASNRPKYAAPGLADRVKAVIEKYFYKNEERIDFRTIDHRALFDRFPAADLVYHRTVRQRPEVIFKGIRSTSFCPDEGDPAFEDLRRALLAAFAEFAVGGEIETIVETKLTYGRLK